MGVLREETAGGAWKEGVVIKEQGGLARWYQGDLTGASTGTCTKSKAQEETQGKQAYPRRLQTAWAEYCRAGLSLVYIQ